MYHRIRPHIGQIARYLVSGTTANAIDIGLYFLLFYTGVYYVTASIVGGIVGFISAFLLHRFFVFRGNKHIGNHFLRYCLLGVLNIAATSTILFACVDLIGIPEEISKFIANGSVVLWNYFLYKFLVYV